MFEIKCEIGGCSSCSDCHLCESSHAYGSCFNCRMRHPLLWAGSGLSDRCRKCAHVPQVKRFGMIPITRTGWVCDGGVEVSAIAKAVFNMHGCPHDKDSKRKAYTRLKNAIKEVEALDYFEI